MDEYTSSDERFKELVMMYAIVLIQLKAIGFTFKDGKPSFSRERQENGACAYVPKDWLGKTVKITLVI